MREALWRIDHAMAGLNSTAALYQSIQGDLSCAGFILCFSCGLCRNSHSRRPRPLRARGGRRPGVWKSEHEHHGAPPHHHNNRSDLTGIAGLSSRPGSLADVEARPFGSSDFCPNPALIDDTLRPAPVAEPGGWALLDSTSSHWPPTMGGTPRAASISNSLQRLRSMGVFSHATRRNLETASDWRKWAPEAQDLPFDLASTFRGKCSSVTPLSLVTPWTLSTHHNTEQPCCLGSSSQNGS